MKRLFTIFIALFAVITMSFAQKSAFSVQSSYSYSTGLVGIEYQYNKFAIGAGIMPFRNEAQEIKPSYSAAVDFGITTKFPHAMPDDVAVMFFNVSTEFDVSVKETSQCVYAGERHFAINIKKN